MPEMIERVRFTDGVVAGTERLVSFPPERGGALLKSGGLVFGLVEDDRAERGPASWRISRRLSERVSELEGAGHGELAGTVHSHPSGVPDPSSMDIETTRKTLELNPHLDKMVIAVASKGRPRGTDLALGDFGRLSVYVLDRGASAPRRMRVEVVPLCHDLAQVGLEPVSTVTESAAKRRSRESSSRGLPTTLRVSGSPRLVVPIKGARRPTAMVFAADYPLTGPVLLAISRCAEGGVALEQLPSPWDPVRPPAAQLRAMVLSATGYRAEGTLARVTPLVGDLAQRRVLVGGCGSVGSYIAEQLVRSGIGMFRLVDPDGVEGVNLARSVYTVTDLGSPKPVALGRRLREINPSVLVEEHRERLSATDLGAAVADVDLVVAATDDPREQALLAHYAYRANKPLVSCALFRRAEAGEVAIVVPALHTPCWWCSVGAAHAGQAPEADYGMGGRLVGEAALGAAIHLVADMAAIVATGLLAGPESPAGAPLVGLLHERRTVGVITVKPGWDWFPEAFGPLAHQHAPQSVWLRAQGADDCPVCGPNPRPPHGRKTGDELAQLCGLDGQPGCESP